MRYLNNLPYWQYIPVGNTYPKRPVSFLNLNPTVYLWFSLGLAPAKSVCSWNNPAHASDGCCLEGEHDASQFNCKRANPSFLRHHYPKRRANFGSVIFLHLFLWCLPPVFLVGALIDLSRLTVLRYA